MFIIHRYMKKYILQIKRAKVEFKLRFNPFLRICVLGTVVMILYV